MFTYNHELYETETHSHGMPQVYATRTASAHYVVRHHIPELLLEFPWGKVRTHSISTFVSHVKFNMISSYSSACIQMNCYIYVSVTRNNYGMLIICMKHVFLEFSISPVKTEFTLSLS